MKNRTTKCFLQVFAILTFTACDSTTDHETKNPKQENVQTEKIEGLFFYKDGGDMGNHLSFSVTVDSSIYDFQIDMNPEKNKKSRNKTDSSFWVNLIRDIDFDRAAKIKTGATHQAYDGVDERLNIKTNKRVIEFTNGQVDTLNYPSVEKLIEQLNVALAKY
jgi:hypothetical protein